MAEPRPAPIPRRTRRAADRHYLAVVAAEARRLAQQLRPRGSGTRWPSGVGETAARQPLAR